MPQEHALARAAPPQDHETPARGDVQRQVVQHLAGAEGLRDVLETHRRFTTGIRLTRHRRGHRLRHQPPAAFGKMKKISRTSTTLATMMPIEENTTARVEARPTPSVPDSVVKPRYEEIVAMMNPKTMVLTVAGT